MDAKLEKKQRQRARRGSDQVFVDGHDRATGLPRFAARFVYAGKRTFVRLHVGIDGEPLRDLDAARLAFARGRERVKAGLPFHEPPKEPEALPLPEAPKLTVRELAAKFKNEAQRDVWDRKGYVRAFGSAFKCSIDPYLGERAAEDVQRKDVATWREKMKADKKNAPTILRAMRAASVMWNWALEHGHLPDNAHNPVAGVGKPRYKPGKELYSEVEVAQLITAAAKNDPALHPIIALAFFTGCRRGEIAALRWGDIDFVTNSINVHRSFKRSARKSGEPLVVGLHPHLRAILEPLAQEDPEALVFPDPSTKERRSDPDAPNGWMRPKHDSKSGCWGLRALAKAAKVKRLQFPWHGFRKSHATSLHEQGATPIDIMTALGQSDVTMAMRYTKGSAKRAAERVAKLPSLGPVKAAKVVSLDAERAKRASGS